MWITWCAHTRNKSLRPDKEIYRGVEVNRYIPKHTAQNVARASGFRCAWCGCYLTEKHHIHAYSLGGSHSEDNLILLCPNCHTEADSGNIPEEELMTRRINLTGEVDRSSGCLSIGEMSLRICVGGNYFTDCSNLLMLNDIPLLSVSARDKHLLISLRLFNKSGNLICWMHNNRWWVENTAVMDFQYTKNTFRITDIDKSEVLNLSIGKDIILVSGHMHLLGSIVDLSRDAITIGHCRFKAVGSIFRGFDNAIIVREKNFDKPIPGKGGILIDV